MYILDVCDSLGPLLGVINFIINAIMVGIPIILILLGMIDLGKAVISSKEDEVKKAGKTLLRRFLYAIGVFAVVWGVTAVFDLISNTSSGEIDPNKAGWKSCWEKIRNS